MAGAREITLNDNMNPAAAPIVANAPNSRIRPVSSEDVSTSRVESWPIAILGVPFDHVTINQAIARVDAMIASRQPHYVVTANVDFLVQAQRDVELRRILLEADLVLCDGTPLLWASRWLGNALPERVAGSDLAPELIRNAAAKGHRIFFLGAAPGVAAEAAMKLRQQHPALNIVGSYSPPFSRLLEMDHAAIAQRVRAAQPDILLVSFGCPKQEKWIAMHHRALGVPVAIGVGATLDFLAGRVQRAPAWMRRTGTEWVYRLWQEPGRLYRRYAEDLIRFFPTLFAQRLRLGSDRIDAEGPHEKAVDATGWCAIDAGSHLTRRSLEHDAACWRVCRAREMHWLIDLSKIQRIDGTGVAFLIRWRKDLLARHRQFVLLAPSAKLRRVLTALGLADHFVIADDAAVITSLVESTVSSHFQQDDATHALAWCGEVVAANHDDIWQMTLDHIRAFAAARATLVIIDLSRLRFIDSSGAALMLRVKKWARSQRVEVLFAHPQANVQNVLRLTRLDQLLLEGSQ